MKKIREQKGITLVALVITIIILIILATIAINFAFGDDGLINRAEQAKDFYANDTQYTDESVTNVESYLDDIIEGSIGGGDDGNEDGDGGETNPPDIPGGEDAIEKGAIAFTNPTWSGGKASVTISTNTSYTLQYQVVANEGASNDANWKAVPQGGVIGNLNHNDIVYARLIQDNHYGEEASATVKDTTPPTISNISTSNITSNSISVTVTASDNETGIASYTYTINGGSQASNTTGSHTFTGLNGGTQYTIQVAVTDKAGYVATDTITTNTTDKPVTNINELVAGNYVTYPSAKGPLSCRVLYDSSSGYGVQLIASSCPEETLELGNKDSFEDSIASYNNGMNVLNEVVSLYNNSTYSTRARPVGSHPTNSDTTIYYTTNDPYISQYNGQIKIGDTNYLLDFEQMERLGIANIDEQYWLGSRYMWENEAKDWASFGFYYVRKTYPTVTPVSWNMVAFEGGNKTSSSMDFKVRPVFVLNSNVKVTGGDGKSAGTAYTLGT